MLFLSIVLGFIDHVLARLTLTTGSLFRKGVGDRANFQKTITALQPSNSAVRSEEIVVHLEPWVIKDGVAVTTGQFISPAADLLPPEEHVQRVNFQVLLPVKQFEKDNNYGSLTDGAK